MNKISSTNVPILMVLIKLLYFILNKYHSNEETLNYTYLFTDKIFYLEPFETITFL